MSAVRTLVVWCPDWPVVAAGVPPDVPAAVVRANRVVACSPAARAEGVAVQQRRRDAQARCPDLLLVDDDPAGAARAFEPLVAALETVAPRLAVVRPGCCAVPTRGPSRYHGGDLALAETVLSLLSAVSRSEQRQNDGACGVGVADGVFTATLAARRAAAAGSTPPNLPPKSAAGGVERGQVRVDGGVLVVPVGESASFLAPLPVRALPVSPELVDVFRRLGLRTLGELAALPVAKVVGRFGAEGLVAHRLARGLDEHPPATTPPPPDLRVATEIDPPAERVEAAAFVARGLADELQRRLAERGSVCTRVVIGAETEHGERLERVWATDAAARSPTAIADRLRWQLDGWLHSAADRPTGGLSRLWLVPDEVVAAGGRQLALPTGDSDATAAAEARRERVGRALARVQGLVGPEQVMVPEWRGGRSPAERITLVPAAVTNPLEPRPAATGGWVTEPWPGTIPDPGPTTVHHQPLPVELLDAAGCQVQVSGRGGLSAPPAVLRRGASLEPAPEERHARRPLGAGSRGSRVVAWAGPWPYEERWWDASDQRRRARMQVVADTGAAHLVVLEGGHWFVEATYD